ncbi:MAG: hypothetical protein ACLQU1_22640 [Bryobacteraceae bacterium]
MLFYCWAAAKRDGAHFSGTPGYRNLRGQYDKLVGIEMFEAVGQTIMIGQPSFPAHQPEAGQ